MGQKSTRPREKQLKYGLDTAEVSDLPDEKSDLYDRLKNNDEGFRIVIRAFKNLATLYKLVLFRRDDRRAIKYFYDGVGTIIGDYPKLSEKGSSISLRSAYLAASQIRAIIQGSGFSENPSGSDAYEASSKGRRASEPPSEEAHLHHNQLETVLLLPKNESVQRGRPSGKERRVKLRPFMVKLTDQEYQRLEKLRRRTSAVSAADTIRAALRAYDAVVEAARAGSNIVFENPKNPRKRVYLKLG
ncbi:MAG TPA: hypothetical protein VKT73_04635 [Xanthobacteraceae bacterium]|nr:hypothetical protein [Xanthobacteraceae bacterium]